MPDKRKAKKRASTKKHETIPCQFARTGFWYWAPVLTIESGKLVSRRQRPEKPSLGKIIFQRRNGGDWPELK